MTVNHWRIGRNGFMKNNNSAELLFGNQDIKVINPGTTVNESDINSLERKLGIQLPPRLRSYYLHWNGGLPCLVEMALSKSVWIRLFWNKDAKASTSGPAADLNGLFEINSTPGMDFYRTWNDFKDRIPHDLLCFARNSGGSLFLIGIKEFNLGKIFFWDRDYEADIDAGEISNYDNIAFVANSFTEFLLALREEPNKGESLADWVKRVYPE